MGKVLIAVIVILVLLIVGGILLLVLGDSESNKYTFPCQCEEDLMNCGDFTTQAEAQECFVFCGGAENDVHRLDADGNGLACEGLE